MDTFPAAAPERGPTGSLRACASLLVLLAFSPFAPRAAAGPAAPEEAPAGAPDPIGEISLFGEEEIEIEAATKTATPLSKAPGTVTVITSRQIRESGARTIPELLRLVAGVNVRWNPMVQTIDVHGFGQNPFTSRVLLLIDGIPYNSWNQGGFDQHPGLDFFVLQNVKRLEVLRGSGSSLYGENAFWGVINIVTLSGEDLEGGRAEVYGGERDTGTVGALYGDRFGEDGSWLVSARYLHSQFPMEYWRESDSNVRGFDLFAKGAWKGIELSWYRHDDEVDGFSEAAPIPGFPPGSSFHSADELAQTNDIVALKYERELRGKELTLGGDLAYARRDGTHCAACHAAPEAPEFLEKADHGHQLIGDVRAGIRMLPGHEILVGLEARQVDAGDHTEELLSREEGGGRVEHDYRKLALYVQDQVELLEGRVNLVGGLRYDGSSDLFDDEVSPRLAAVWSPTDALVLRGSWSRAFRFPNFSELYQDSWFFNLDIGPVGVPLAVFQPNPGLRPEEIRTFELGGEYRFNPSLSARLNLFRSDLENFIVLAFGLAPPPAPAALRMENHPDDARVLGSELELRWNLARGVTGFANWTWQDHEQDGELVDSTGKRFEFVYAPEHRFNLGSYLGPFRGFGGAVELSWKGEQDAPSFWNSVLTNFADTGLGTIESYGLLDLRVHYDLPVRVGGNDRAVRASLHGRNLFDEKPAETLIGVSTELPGRELFGGLEVRF